MRTLLEEFYTPILLGASVEHLFSLGTQQILHCRADVGKIQLPTYVNLGPTLQPTYKQAVSRNTSETPLQVVFWFSTTLRKIQLFILYI